jgi:hypothetical protein
MISFIAYHLFSPIPRLGLAVLSCHSNYLEGICIPAHLQYFLQASALRWGFLHFK